MKASFKLALTLSAGIAVGGGLINALHAQAISPAYAIVDISTLKDPEGFKALIPKASPEQKFTAIDGTPPERFVVIEFDSLDKANAWAAAGDTKEINAIRTRTTASRAFIVEGM
jgi:hypothetical protein